MSTATTHINKEKELVPALRFKEFDGHFQLKEFDEITDITRLAGYEYSKYWKEDEEQEIIALRGYNIGRGELVLRDLGYISNALSMQLIRSRLSIGDIVYPCVGSIGNAVVIEENDKFHIQQNIAKITCNEFASPYYVVHFLTSDYGMREV
jgi:type I restriction enzyme S subunit